MVSSTHHKSKPQMTTTASTHKSMVKEKHLYFDLDYYDRV